MLAPFDYQNKKSTILNQIINWNNSFLYFILHFFVFIFLFFYQSICYISHFFSYIILFIFVLFHSHPSMIILIRNNNVRDISEHAAVEFPAVLSNLGMLRCSTTSIYYWCMRSHSHSWGIEAMDFMWFHLKYHIINEFVMSIYDMTLPSVVYWCSLSFQWI